GLELLRRHDRRRPADRACRVSVRHRQPGQGRLGERRAEPEHHDGLGRADGPRRTSGVPVTRMQEIQWLEGGITTVPGILASGIAAGIKPSGKKDLALIYSSSPARAAAVFTTNQIKGAPVLVSQEH